MRYPRDFGDAEGTVYENYLRYVLKQPSATNLCASVTDAACNMRGNSALAVMMRQLCPSRCGCSNPREGTASNPSARSASFGFMGCATWNLRTKKFQHALAELPCADITDRNRFALWANGLGDSTVAKANGTRILIRDGVMASFDDGGCSEVVKFDIGGGSSSKICSETSLAATCPSSCGCNISLTWNSAWTQQAHFCPLSCGRALPTCFTVDNEDDGGYPEYLAATYESGYPCIFPFTFDGKEYTNCTMDDWHAPWCAVILTVDGAVAKWGDCASNCYS